MPVDGKLAPWKAVGGYRFDPLARLIKSGGNADIERLLSNPISAADVDGRTDTGIPGLNLHNNRYSEFRLHLDRFTPPAARAGRSSRPVHRPAAR